MAQIEIHVKGNIDPGITDWFQGLSVQLVSPEESCLCCEVADNAAIYGILSTLSTLRLSLISVAVSDDDGIRFIPTSPSTE